MRPRGLAEATLVAVCSFVLTSILTYPLAFEIDRIGRVNTDDGRWSIWVIAWVAHALTTNPLGLYDANIFYPHRWTLAFSEANLGGGILGAPVWALTGNPYTTHNVVVVLGFMLSAAGAYYLTRHLTGSRTGAAVAAVLFAFCPFIYARTAHIQLLLTFGLPWTLLAFHRLIERQTVARSVVLGVLLWFTAMTCAYYGIFAALMVGLGTLLYAWTRELWRKADFWIAIGLAALISIGLTLPFFLPYVWIQNEQGFTRTLEDAQMYSADWGAWLASSAWAHRWWLDALGGYNEVLFPGILATVLGLWGLWTGWKNGVGPVFRAAPAPAAAATPDAGPRAAARDTLVLYVLIAVISFWASFGPDGGLYTLLFHTIPVFSFLRGPGRMGILVVLALAVFAAMAVSALVDRRPRRHILAAALVLLASVELMTAPLRQLRAADPMTPAHRMLATLPRGPVAEFPYFYERHDFPRHAYYMLQSTAHWQPLINGYSDHIPEDWRRAVVPLSSFPTRESFGILGRLGARYAVFHLNMYDRRSRERLMERLKTYGAYLRPLLQEGDVWLFEIVDWPN